MSEKIENATVLIVDDHTPAADMVSRIFSMRGFEAIAVNDGEEAIKVAQSTLPDLILLDVMMPGMDGFQVLDQLRKNPKTATIPVIFVTAKDEAADIEQGLGLGADDYIPKPIKPREVVARAMSKIEARRLQDKLTSRRTELEAILRFSQELNTQLDVETLLNLILYLVIDLVPCSAAIIYRLDADMNVLEYREHHKHDEDTSTINVETLFNHIISTPKTPIMWNDTQIQGAEYDNGIAIRLDHDTQTQGILVVLSNKTYGEHEMRLFETIARQTTLALRNAELYETKVHYAEHLEEMVEQRTEELRSAEALLIRSEKLASVGRLAAGIAHEINNPLMPIRMNLEMMQEDIENNVAITHQDIDETLRSVNRISRIVERLQQFTRGRGDDTLEMEPIHLSDVIESVLSLSATYIRHNGINVHTQLDNDAYIYGNRDQLEQVFLNITLNAQAAMDGGGELTIQTIANEDDVEVRFTDTGHGIEPEMIEKIFEPFISTKDDGSGLGLFISHNIIHNHSGNIEVQSEVGKGSTFLLTLPTIKEQVS